jgi:hypothetical protein
MASVRCISIPASILLVVLRSVNEHCGAVWTSMDVSGPACATISTVMTPGGCALDLPRCCMAAVCTVHDGVTVLLAG